MLQLLLYNTVAAPGTGERISSLGGADCIASDMTQMAVLKNWQRMKKNLC